MLNKNKDVTIHPLEQFQAMLSSLESLIHSRRVKTQPGISVSRQFSFSLNWDKWLHSTVRRLQVRQILLGKVRGKGALPGVSITDNLQTVPRAALHSFIKTETVAGPAYCNFLWLQCRG